MALIEHEYYWPQMKEEVEVNTCLKNKIEQKQPGSLLEPLPIPAWESISMDFIMALPKHEKGFITIFYVLMAWYDMESFSHPYTKPIPSFLFCDSEKLCNWIGLSHLSSFSLFLELRLYHRKRIA